MRTKSLAKTGLFFFFFLIFLNGFAQEVTISGVVTDEVGDVLPGVNIQIKGTTSGTVTDFDGNFTLSLERGDVLAFSFIGYATQEIEILDQTQLKIVLQPDLTELAMVVVIGYGTQLKKDITGSTGLVSASDVDLQPIQRVEGMLQGRVAGVVVSQNSGAPGTTAKVNVRGFTGGAIYVIDGFIGADINTINPNDIESISILKDASATAIYGARGANGVILVTTKKGTKNSPLNIDVDYFHTISKLNRKLDLLDPLSYMKIVNKKLKEGGANEIFSDAELDEAKNTPGYGTDWQDEVFRLAHADNLNLSATKGWDNTSVRLSLGARKDNGIIKNSDYQRFTSRVNINSQITNTTKLIFNGSYSFEKTHNIFQSGNRSDGQNDVVAAATAWSPNLSVIDPLTNDYTGFQGYGATVRRNPAYLVNEVNRVGKNNVYNANLTLEQELFTGFKVKAFGAAQQIKGGSEKFKRYEPATLGSTTVISESDNDSYSYQGNLQLDYSKVIGGKHSITAIGVFEALKRKNEQYSATTTYPLPGQPGDTVRSEGFPRLEPESMLSFLSRVGYSFQDKIILTASLRTDGSSRLPEGNKWGTFLSGAIAYRISDESFMENVSVISDLKLRASYGGTGNVNSLNAFQVQDLTNPKINGYTYSGYIVSPAEGFEDGSNRANPELIWETSNQFDAGFDLTLLEGMVAFTADYYIKYTNDSHFNKAAPRFLGGGTVKTNTGGVKNSGLELTLITKWVSKSDFTFNTSINASFNQSKVLKIPQDTIHVGSRENGFDRQSHILILGQQVGQLYGYQYLGPKITGETIDGEVPGLQPGDAVYRDINGDGLITLKDMAVIGNGHPDFTWGFNAYLGYKKFTLNIFIQGVHGIDVFNIPQHGLLGGGAGVLDATSVEILDSWSFNSTGLPKLTALYEPQSSLFVEDASFVRVKNITLAYEVSEKTLTKLKLKRLRVYGGAQNIFTFTNYSGYDPESKSGSNLAPGVDRGSFPIPVAFTFGINLGI